jgi:hypothetical protein
MQLHPNPESYKEILKKILEIPWRVFAKISFTKTYFFQSSYCNEYTRYYEID